MRLVLLAAGWSLAALLLASVGLGAYFRQSAIGRLDQTVLEQVNNLYAGTSVDDTGQVAAPPLTDARALRVYSGRYWQIAELADDGAIRVLTPSRSLFQSEIAIPQKARRALAYKLGEPVFFDARDPLNQPLRGAALAARLPGHVQPLVFVAAEDSTLVEREARRFAATAASAVVLLGLGLIVAVIFQVQVGLAPLFALRREVSMVRTGKLERLKRRYPVELAPLAEELNALVEHNQEVVERQRTHVGNLAHALKTPLSVMLAEAGQQPGDLADIVRAQADAMRGHVDHHLRRARAAARSTTVGERTNVAQVLDELAVALERIHQDKALIIDWRAPDDLTFQGERQDLMEIAGNVIDNAAKWAARRVRVTAEPAGPGRFFLVVDDDGRGLTPDQYPQALKRGARLDETAPGSGLGLAIVDDLTRAYGGELALDAAPAGGLRVRVILPMAEG